MERHNRSKTCTHAIDPLKLKRDYSTPSLLKLGHITTFTQQTSAKPIFKKENNGHPDGYR